MENKVLAVVEGKEITEEIVERFLQELGPQLSMQFGSEEGRKRIVEELVNQELVYLDALEKELDQDEVFLSELEKMKEGLLKQYVVSKLFEEVALDDKEVREYYDDNPEYFVRPETITAKHILVETEEEAKNVVKEIEEGLAFEEAASKYSTCPSNQQGGNLGQFGRGQMVPEFEAAAFKLDLGQLSEPVKTDFGYHLIVVEEKTEEGTFPYEEVSEQIKSQLLGAKQQARYEAKTDELKTKYKVEYNI